MNHILLRGKLRGKKAYQERPHKKSDAVLKLEKRGFLRSLGGVLSRGVAEGRAW